jgi:hypothetical protein
VAGELGLELSLHCRFAAGARKFIQKKIIALQGNGRILRLSK